MRFRELLITSLILVGNLPNSDGFHGKRAAASDRPARVNFAGHGELVSAVALTRDGKTLVSGSWDHTVKIWDVETRKEKAELRGHQEPVTSVAISPDAGLLATASTDRTVRIWNVAKGTASAVLRGHRAAVYSVAFSPDGETLVSGSYDGTVKLWKVASRSELATLESDGGPVYSVAFAPDGKSIASGHFETNIRLWETQTGKCTGTLSGHAHFVWSLAFAANGKLLASGSGNRTEKPGGRSVEGSGQGDVKVWDLASQKEIFSHSFPDRLVRCVALAADCRTLAVCGHDAVVRIWDSAAGKLETEWDSQGGRVGCVAFDNTGKTLVAGCDDSTIGLWDFAPPSNEPPQLWRASAEKQNGEIVIQICRPEYLTPRQAVAAEGMKWRYLKPVAMGESIRAFDVHGKRVDSGELLKSLEKPKGVAVFVRFYDRLLDPDPTYLEMLREGTIIFVVSADAIADPIP